MKALFVILVFCLLALLGVAAAVFRLARQHMRKQASDTTLRQALQEIEQDRKTGIKH